MAAQGLKVHPGPKERLYPQGGKGVKKALFFLPLFGNHHELYSLTLKPFCDLYPFFLFFLEEGIG